MEDADHGALPTTVEVHDKEHYRPKLHALSRHFFTFSSTPTQRGYPQPQCTNLRFIWHTLLCWSQ